jgi:SAM-dependent methyltransferase
VSLAITPTFGSGGAETYANALTGERTVFLQGSRGGRTPMDVARWNASADLVDLTLLSAVNGPVLDIGCGPGRMVKAAHDLGLAAMGIDVSPTAVEIARKLGVEVVQGSVFDFVPRAGTWQTALLVDGNIGIGGDVAALLERCAELISLDGEIVIEVDSTPDRLHTYTAALVDDEGGTSETFPWAEVGANKLVEIARPLGLRLRQSWELEGRGFCRLALG